MKSVRKHLVALGLVVTLVLWLPHRFDRPTVRAQEKSTSLYTTGAAGLGELLRRLQTTASVMHTGAHPDDEDSALIARLMRGSGARVAYLSLNRGEGGQNRLGPELFDTLGVIRTEELLQARRIDGGDQFFTRAYDFGFSKTRAEAAEKWGERNILGDMVRAIRLYRPLVIISRFTGTPADGHGHHQFAGYLTPLAFHAAADPSQFPEQIAAGLRPWQAQKLYVSASPRQPEANTAPPPRPILKIDTGRFDPLVGHSYYDVAMEGRSQHKSQEMGTLELHGAQSSGVRLVESLIKTGDTEESIFDGLDVSITGIAHVAGLSDDAMAGELAVIQKAAARALTDYDAFNPQKIVAPLAEGLAHARRARETLARARLTADAQADADFLLAQKEREFTEALRLAAGVTFDALSDVETIAPGESFVVTLRLFFPAGSPVRPIGLQLRAPDNWRVEQIQEPPAPTPSSGGGPSARREVAQQSASFRVTVPADEPATEPYWLRQPRNGDLYRWPARPQSVPFDPPLLVGEATMQIGDAPLEVSEPVQYRYADPVRGELRRDLNVVPALSVALDPGLIIVPVAPQDTTRRVVVRLSNNSERAESGHAGLRLPDNWRCEPRDAPFTLRTKGEHASIVFNITIPGNLASAAYRISPVATTADGQTFDQTEITVAYPHIQTHRLYRAAETDVQVFDFKVAPVNVGYVMGSGDEVPEAIKRMGLGVTMLDENELSTGDLSRFDTIVIGIRASQTRPDFVANNERLLDYVRRGGTLIVQYQRPDYAARGLTPFRAEMEVRAAAGGEPAISRVTDENAPVRVLQPGNPIFNFPNRITDEDWKGWVQERNLYSFTSFDSRYVPLLESHDPGEGAQTGGEMYAEIGRGHYVYTSYAWFRQLPAGVPGTYRLFANLLSLPKASKASDK